MVRLCARRRQVALLIGFAAALAGLSGCVERRYTIRTDPPGALAIVNGEEIGPTPVSRPFTYYGDRKITLMLDGYNTKTVIQPIVEPWWDNLITEFFVENMIPYTFRDERDYTFPLETATVPETTGLVARAEALRAEGHILPPPRTKWLSDYIRGWLPPPPSPPRTGLQKRPSDYLRDFFGRNADD
jgi:PEGA domain